MLQLFVLIAMQSSSIPSQALTSQQDKGVYVRMVNFHVKPASIREWTAAVRDLSKALEQGKLAKQPRWLMHVAKPGNYFLVTFADTVEELLGSRSLIDGLMGVEFPPATSMLKRLHSVKYGLDLQKLDLTGCATREEVLQRVRERAANTPPTLGVLWVDSKPYGGKTNANPRCTVARNRHGCEFSDTFFR